MQNLFKLYKCTNSTINICSDMEDHFKESLNLTLCVSGFEKAQLGMLIWFKT